MIRVCLREFIVRCASGSLYAHTMVGESLARGAVNTGHWFSRERERERVSGWFVHSPSVPQWALWTREKGEGRREKRGFSTHVRVGRDRAPPAGMACVSCRRDDGSRVVLRATLTCAGYPVSPSPNRRANHADPTFSSDASTTSRLHLENGWLVLEDYTVGK